MIGTPATRNLRQKITYWAPSNGSETNEFGHVETSSGVLINGRWEDNIQTIRRPNGDEVVSMSVVYVDRDLEIGGFLKLGELEGAALADDAQEIQNFMVTPDLRNLSQERRAYL